MSLFKKSKQRNVQSSVWARPEMPITFRAEIMPGKSRDERTFRVKNVMRNGRVTLYGFTGEHRESEFEAINFSRENP